MHSDFDGAWKEALDRFLAFILAFFFPDVFEDIDWTQDCESLEQELRELLPQSEAGRRLCDKLVKVHVRGSDDLAYLHVEVQNQQETDFERRVYVYNYRGEDRFNQPEDSLDVYGDDNAGWRPAKYVFEKWGCKKTFKFPAVKLLNYRRREKQLETNENPIAVLVLAHLKAIETRQDAEARRDWKVRLIKGLYGREKLDSEDFRHLFRCIDWILGLPREMAQQVSQELIRFEEERQMTKLTSLEIFAREEGVEEGLEKGLRSGIEKFVKFKFGTLDPVFHQELLDQKAETLSRVLDAIEQATSLDDLRRLLPAKNGSETPAS